MRNRRALDASFVAALLMVSPCGADDNQLSAAEQAAGWQLLFSGRDHTGWTCSNGQPIASPVEAGSLVPYQAGGYMITYEKPQGDFKLKCDVRMAKPYCNSGIFFRVGDLDRVPQSGLECQIASASFSPYQSFGAIYDLARPRKTMIADDPWGWHTVEITCRGPHVEVAVDGQVATTMNCDQFTEKGRRPDGSRHKFDVAIKDLPRSGYLGFQDHGSKCWYKNIKLLALDNGR